MDGTMDLLLPVPIQFMDDYFVSKLYCKNKYFTEKI